MLAGRVFRVLVEAIDGGLRAVAEEFSADHFNEGPEAVERIRRAVHADEGVPGFDPIDERLRVGQWEVAGGVGENDTVIVLEGRGAHLFGEHALLLGGIIFQGFLVLRFRFLELFQGRIVFLGVGFEFVGVSSVLGRRRLAGSFGWHDAGEVHGERAAFPAQFFDDTFRNLDGAVTETGGGGDDENFCRFRRGWRRGAAGQQNRGGSEQAGAKNSERVFHNAVG